MQNDRIVRAVDLMDKTGWITQKNTGPLLTGIALTEYGQRQAEAFLRILRELECRSPDDLESVLGVLSWYLNRDEMN